MANPLPDRFQDAKPCTKCGATRKCCRSCRRCQRHCRCEGYEPLLIKELTLNVWGFDPEVTKAAGKDQQYILAFKNVEKKQVVTLIDVDFEQLVEAIFNKVTARELRLRIAEDVLSSASENELREMLELTEDNQLRQVMSVAQRCLA